MPEFDPEQYLQGAGFYDAMAMAVSETEDTQRAAQREARLCLSLGCNCTCGECKFHAAKWSWEASNKNLVHCWEHAHGCHRGCMPASLRGQQVDDG